MGSYPCFRFSGWLVLVRHDSIKVLWWLAFAFAINIPFSFVPSSCRGSGRCLVSEDVSCLVVGSKALDRIICSVYCCVKDSFQGCLWGSWCGRVMISLHVGFCVALLACLW